jgi:hypothetical protein
MFVNVRNVIATIHRSQTKLKIMSLSTANRSYRAFNDKRKPGSSVERIERFSATAVPFTASESAVVSLIPSHQFLYMHTFIRIL